MTGDGVDIRLRSRKPATRAFGVHRTRFVLARSGHDPIEIGERITGFARLQPPSGPALPGTFDFAFNAYFNDLGAFEFFLGPPEQVLTPQQVSLPPALWLAQLRETIGQRIRAALPGEAGAFASALTVADRRAMSEGTVEALRASGLAHVLAISGLHMALVAGTVFLAVRLFSGCFPALRRPLRSRSWRRLQRFWWPLPIC